MGSVTKYGECYKSWGVLHQRVRTNTKELEELFAEAMAQNAKTNKTDYKNVILNNLKKQDLRTVNNFNEWLKDRQVVQAKQELQNKLNNFDYKKIIGKDLVLSGVDVKINSIVHIANDFVEVALNDGTYRELPKVGILQRFGELVA